MVRELMDRLQKEANNFLMDFYNGEEEEIKKKYEQ